jgi:hypothetical protein
MLSNGFSRWKTLAVLVCAGAPLLGCDGITTGVKEADAQFTVLPVPGSFTYYAWTEITIQQDAQSVNRATLNALTLETISPADTPNLTYLQSVSGAIKSGDEEIPAAQITSFPEEESAVTADILYKDDLRPFFADGHTIHIDWQGNVNPSYPIPAEGIVVGAHVFVLVA